MSRKKRHTINELEEQVSELNKENRRLRRQLNHAKKTPKSPSIKSSELIHDDSTCPQCGKGELLPMVFEFSTYTLSVVTCSFCEFKMKTKEDK